MIEIKNGILGIEKDAIIIHQVNCQKRIYGNSFETIVDKYPQVAERYKKNCEGVEGENLLGGLSFVEENNNLTIVSLFTQLYYGNATKTNCVYTDYDAINFALQTLKFVKMMKCDDRQIYAPEFFGCEEAGGNWNIIKKILESYGVIVVRNKKITPICHSFSAMVKNRNCLFLAFLLQNNYICKTNIIY